MDSQYNESQEAVLGCRTNFCVTAGAGSGKTGTIVEYIIRYVEGDLARNSITQVLVLTFSEKAAAELNERISHGIRERLRDAKRAGDLATAAAWEREFRRLGQAEIGTIHGYAFGLVKTHSHLLGLPTNVDVNPSELSPLDIFEVLKDLLNENNRDLSYLIRLLPLKADLGPSIIGWLLTCVNRVTSWGLPGLTSGVNPPRAEAPALFGALSAAVASALDYVQGPDFDERKYPNPAAGVRALATVLDSLSRNRSFPNDPAVPALTDNVPITHLPRFLFEAEPSVNLLSSWRKKQNHNHKQEIKEAFDKLKCYQASVEAGPVTEALVRLANRIPPLLREKGLAKSQIGFDDILSSARYLLKNDPGIRATESARWKLIIVDEFQDTNRLQADLIAQLIPETGQGHGFEGLDWPRVPPKLRVVGDPKQSIYRFRGSEPSIMANLSAVLSKGGGRVLTLDTNYRTQSPLIDFYNDFFPSVLSEAHEPQKAARKPLYAAKPVVCLTDDESGSRVPCDIQAVLMVHYLRTLFDGRAGVTLAEKPRAGSPDPPPRLPTPGDVAILLRRKKNADVYQAAISEAGWPCHTLKGQELFDIPEITGLASAYLYLCGRSVDLNLAAALCSPLGPISEEILTLLAWPPLSRERNENLPPPPVPISWYFQDETRGWPDGIDEFDLGALIRIRRLFLSLKPYVLRRPMGEIIECLVEERHLLPLLVSGDGGSPDRVRNIQYFIDLAKTIPLMDPHGPESAADVIENLFQSGLNKGESGDAFFAGLPDEGSINIMTVHRSKGLEFPIVIIPEADVAPRKDNTGLRISDDGRVVIRFRSETMGSRLEPPEFGEFRNAESAFEAAENARLLYVASTRARDHLVFVGQLANPTPGSWLNALKNFDKLNHYARVINYATEVENAKPPVPAQTAPAPTAPPPRDPIDDFDPALIRRAPFPEFYQLPVTFYCRVCAAFKNGASGFEEASRIAWSALSVEESPLYASVGPKDGQISPSERGTVFHSILENSPFDLDMAGYRALALEQAHWHGFDLNDDEVEFLASKAHRFQTSEYGHELKEAMDAGRLCRREWPFWMSLPKDENGIGPIQISGVIDLFYVNDKGQGRLIDFKLAKPGPSYVYEKQLEIYTMAVKKAGFKGDILSKIWYSGP
ncbi:MAG: UvrD-helicase domain-containing protein [Deltaproteobacteria bacterium]|jgi:ATP-dependent helicase/nuclease subunit A|nr:UvrD-helicase domain-containing protein [Deltaproteobacteria bacterium]